MIKTIEFTCPTFFSEDDENSFFDRLNTLLCIKKIVGQGRSLNIELESPDDNELRELISVLYRYNVEMRCMSVLLDEGNRHWFYENNSSYWHEKVWGE